MICSVVRRRKRLRRRASRYASGNSAGRDSARCDATGCHSASRIAGRRFVWTIDEGRAKERRKTTTTQKPAEKPAAAEAKPAEKPAAATPAG